MRSWGKVVPPERVELSSPAPEAGTLSTELQGRGDYSKFKLSRFDDLEMVYIGDL